MRWKQLFTPVQSLETKEAQALMAGWSEGSYTLLDVRQPGEYEKEHLPGAILIPLPDLADAYSRLDPSKPIIIYWSVGGRSRVAAQFLSGQGFREVYNLKGGIQAWQGLKARGPVELNLDLIRGDETQEEMVVIAYGLEKALEEFYRDSAREGLEEALLNLFRTLAAAEERHQRLLTDLLPGLAGRTEAGPKEEGPAALMEGGFRSGEFRRENQSFLSTPSGVLDLAMMIETQALDLYLRFAQKIVAEAVRAVLYRLADEEKNHLKALGRYRDQGQDTAPEAP